MSDDLDICYRSDLRAVESNLLEQNKRLEASLIEATNLINKIRRQLNETNNNVTATKELHNQKISSLSDKVDKDKIEINKTATALSFEIKNITTERDDYRREIMAKLDPIGIKIKKFDQAVNAMNCAVKYRFDCVGGKILENPTDKNLLNWVFVFFSMINEYERKLK